MRLSTSSLRWIVLFAIVLPIAWVRISGALMSDEERIRGRIESLLSALEERQPRRIGRALTDEFEDEATGYRRRDVIDAARAVLIPGTRYRATLREPGGIEIVELSDESAEPRTATVSVRCLIESRPGGANAPNSTEADFRPWWDMEFTAELERHGGDWMVARTRDVNHGERPRR